MPASNTAPSSRHTQVLHMAQGFLSGMPHMQLHPGIAGGVLLHHLHLAGAREAPQGVGVDGRLGALVQV